MNPITAHISENQEITDNIFRLRIKVDANLHHVNPGRFFMIGVGDGHDPLLRRPLGHMGIVDGLHEFLYEIRGRGTKLLSEMDENETITMIGPLGTGFDLAKLSGRVLMVAGGMGVVPLYAAARSLEQKDPDREVCFLFGARDARGLVLSDEVDNTCSETLFCTEDGCVGEQGLVTDLLAKKLDEDIESSILACGPRPMLKAVAKIAMDRGVLCKVSLEARMACGMGACLTCVVKGSDGKNVRVCKEGPVFDASAIDWDALDDGP